ncbi:hypothetical protein DL95DRAFT_185612 [Leptodontidium sp. 2 PMI_412]|nr:hypothetical protein DL95DRAFT_185612 [Leptodontidium sp. 2 PMI_412]
MRGIGCPSGQWSFFASSFQSAIVRCVCAIRPVLLLRLYDIDGWMDGWRAGLVWKWKWDIVMAGRRGALDQVEAFASSGV